MGKKTPKDDYHVGYGNPPKATQYKPGQSGNPSGKKKGTRNRKLHEMFLDEAQSEILIKESGAEVQLMKIELVFKALFAKAAKGDMAALRMVIALFERYQHLQNDPHKNFSWDEEAVKLAERMEKLAKAAIERRDEKDEED